MKETKNGLKNLATCTPTEFAVQTVKIKNLGEKWLKETDILNIRQRPKYEVIPPGATAEEEKAVIERNAKIEREAVYTALSNAFDKLLVENARDTLNLLALCCFVEPKDKDKYTIEEYLECLLEMANSKVVNSFFTFLARQRTV